MIFLLHLTAASPVLHVPNFSLNLLYIGHLTKTLNSYVIVFLSYCVFQVMETKRMIGLRHEKDGLYILDSSPVTTFVINGKGSSTSDQLSSWHRRLGHLSLHVIRKTYPRISFTQSNSYC